MGNKRVSELTQIINRGLDGLSSADLLLLSDVSAQESKKLTIDDLNNYILSNGNISGSFFGTSSWAIHAVSASYTNVQSSSYARTASFSLNGSTGTSISSSWASQSLSSSYSKTASFVSVVSATSSSYSSVSQFSNSASFVIYSGGNNGTIANAINAVN